MNAQVIQFKGFCKLSFSFGGDKLYEKFHGFKKGDKG